MTPDEALGNVYGRAVRRIAVAIVMAAMLASVTATPSASVPWGSLRVKHVDAQPLTDSAASLAIDLAWAGDPAPTGDSQAQARFRIHLVATNGRWRSGWIEAPRLRSAEQSMTCVIRLPEGALPDDLRIEVVAADGRVLARKRWRRSAASERESFRSWGSSRIPRGSTPAMGSGGAPTRPPVESTPTIPLSWGQLKRLYRVPAI